MCDGPGVRQEAGGSEAAARGPPGSRVRVGVWIRAVRASEQECCPYGAAGCDVKLPDALVRVEKVGQFRTLVEMSEANNDLKNKVRGRAGVGWGGYSRNQSEQTK